MIRLVLTTTILLSFVTGFDDAQSVIYSVAPTHARTKAPIPLFTRPRDDAFSAQARQTSGNVLPAAGDDHTDDVSTARRVKRSPVTVGAPFRLLRAPETTADQSTSTTE